MKKSLLFTNLFLAGAFLIVGCAAHTKLADYQPKSAEEKEVIDLMLERDETIRNRDLAKYMDCYHDNASIMIPEPGEYQRMGSKRTYQEALEGGYWAQAESDVMLDPKITVMGDKATLNCTSPYGTFLIKHNYELVKENEKWSIISHRFQWR